MPHLTLKYTNLNSRDRPIQAGDRQFVYCFRNVSIYHSFISSFLRSSDIESCQARSQEGGGGKGAGAPQSNVISHC